jgi:hypothetical protein
MGTAVTETSLVLSMPVEILAPGSQYDERRGALRAEYDRIVNEAKKVTEINTAEDAETATNLGRLLQAGTKESEIFFAPIKRQIDNFKAPILQHEKEFLASLEGEKRRLGSLLTSFNEKCRLERQNAERKAREEAERQAREDQLARAVELDVAGDADAAEQVLAEPIFVPVVTQTVVAKKIAGNVSKTNYKCMVTNFMDLVKAVAEGKAPIQAISVNQEFLNGQARLYKEAFSMPGCRLDTNNGTHFRA